MSLDCSKTLSQWKQKKKGGGDTEIIRTDSETRESNSEPGPENSKTEDKWRHHQMAALSNSSGKSHDSKMASTVKRGS